jgi:hypothetical protein
MKKHKARNVFLVVATLVFVASAFAQPGTVERQQHFQALTMKNFRYALKSDIQGVVEGTIFDVVVYKKYYPELDYSGILDRLNDLAVEGKAPLVRYKAHLASMYLTSGEQINIVPAKDTWDQDAVFRQIAEQLEKNLLSSDLSGTTTSAR